jgi:hypothetical protein
MIGHGAWFCINPEESEIELYDTRAEAQERASELLNDQHDGEGWMNDDDFI